MAHFNAKGTLKEINYTTSVQSGEFDFLTDISESAGGQNKGPTPKQYLLGALIGCTTITVKIYAQHKGWDIGELTVEADLTQDEERNFLIIKKLHFTGDLTKKQLDRLYTISEKCPVAKMIKNKTKLITQK